MSFRRHGSPGPAAEGCTCGQTQTEAIHDPDFMSIDDFVRRIASSHHGVWLWWGK
jgi:hypothetical protein